MQLSTLFFASACIYTGWPRSYRKYILQITQTSQYGYAKLQYRFAVTSGSPSSLSILYHPFYHSILSILFISVILFSLSYFCPFHSSFLYPVVPSTLPFHSNPSICHFCHPINPFLRLPFPSIHLISPNYPSIQFPTIPSFHSISYHPIHSIHLQLSYPCSLFPPHQ